MTSTYDETRARGECKTCGWSSSGAMWRVEDRADEHEEENPSHLVEVK